jgi:diguanylate cyclase (GGDEF)-like protein
VTESRGLHRGARLRARRRIWAAGALALVVVAGFGALGVRPLVDGRRDDARVRSSVALLQQLADLRAALSAWQVYVQPYFTDLSSKTVKLGTTEVATAAVLAQTEASAVASVVKSLRSHDLVANARELETASARFTRAIGAFAPIVVGAKAGLVDQTVKAEAASYSEMLAVTGHVATEVRAKSSRDLEASIGRLDAGRKTLLLAGGIVALALVIGIGVAGQQARRRERIGRRDSERQAYETAFQDALDMAKTEADAYALMAVAFTQTVPGLQVELLVADSSRAHFHQALSTERPGAPLARSGCSVGSPFDCPATRRGHTLLFPTSRALNACPYLKGRPSGELSAACVPISLTGRTSGVVHATGPDGVAVTPIQTQYLELTSRLAAERIAMLRAFEKSETQAHTDPLTGLWNRRSLENRVRDLTRDGTPYALAYGDLDHFKILNDTHGHEAGDQALRLFARVLGESMRPGDVTARYGGEEFVIILPNCALDTAVKVLERVREQLALTLTTGRVPPFTVSFGLASSIDADTFDEVVSVADHALLTAKQDGRNRTVIATRAERADEPRSAVDS